MQQQHRQESAAGLDDVGDRRHDEGKDEGCDFVSGEEEEEDDGLMHNQHILARSLDSGAAEL